ncbi:MAG: hypothetical protein PHG85_03725 [Candidatus Altiarchaeota archaeon]|nr:hypothetical protein [Candidatus Altiarchaeota archaeon]
MTLNMSKLDSLKEVGSRIRWKSVLAVIVVVFIAIIALTSLPSGYTVKDDIGIKAAANPDTIKPNGKTTLEIEVKNMKEDRVEVEIGAKAYDELLTFSNTSSTQVMTTVKIGPKEVRRLYFDMELMDGALEGKYGIEISAKPENKIEGVVYQLYINVRK